MVPPVLHITLGIVLYLYNLLLKHVKELDATESSIALQRKAPLDLEDEWKIACEEMEKKEKEIRMYDSAFVDLCNFRDRTQAIRSGDLALNDDIAKQSDNSRKRAKKQEKCASLRCCISDFDGNIFWIKCDTCEKRMHSLCEGFSSTEEKSLSELDNYCRLSCGGVEYIIANLEAKFNSIRIKQTELESRFKALRDRCLQFRLDAEEAMGPLELSLLTILDDIKVVRQAFHGNIFVGNHCKIILRNHGLLCSVLCAKPDLKAKFVEIFSIFAQVQPLLFHKKILTPEEISEVNRLCTRFGECYPVLFADANITRKMHELIFDVPHFLAKHKTR